MLSTFKRIGILLVLCKTKYENFINIELSVNHDWNLCILVCFVLLSVSNLGDVGKIYY